MFTLPELPYDYKALEPFIDEETMHVHHDKHHAAYVKNLNDALAGHDELLNMDINELLKNFDGVLSDEVPEEIRLKVKNNAGGVANHNLFWELMCPIDACEPPGGALLESITSTFGSVDGFKEKFTAAALGHFGSGWAWLTLQDGKLEIIDTMNQDSPVTLGKTPILALDVWEHAYYLKYKNMRADYISAWWNVVNWKKVEELFGKVGDNK